MSKRWNRRPDGSNWGEFGDDDRRGRMNLLTAERRLRALKEVKTGRVFCLSHPLDKPGGSEIAASAAAPAVPITGSIRCAPPHCGVDDFSKAGVAAAPGAE